MENALQNLFVLASYIIGISFFAYVTASISNFLDENLEKGKVFDFYGKWVRKEVWLNNERKEKIDYLKSCCQYAITDDQPKTNQVFAFVEADYSAENTVTIEREVHVPKWKKPLGACVYCANTWVNIILLLPALEKGLHFYLVSVIVAAALSNTFLGKINK